jgi:hypothetical protein
MNNLTITNKRIVDFYKSNPTVNFEAVNLIFVDLFQNLLGDIQGAMNATIQSQILTNTNAHAQQMNEMKTTLSALTDKVSTLNHDITNNMTVKYLDIKRDYIEDVKNIIANNTSEKIVPLLEKTTSQLIDKTTSVIGEIIPKNNDIYNAQIQDTMKSFNKTIKDDMLVLSKSVDTTTIKDFIGSFELKSAMMLQNVQQPIYTFISAGEDRISASINGLKESSNVAQQAQSKIFADLNTFLHKYRSTCATGQFGENQLSLILTQLYNTAEINNTSEQYATGNFIMKRELKPLIMFENKDSETNASAEEIKKFIRDTEEKNCHGIFLSQHSGIASKPNYHIETHGGNILVYIHNVNYSSDKIQIAVDIIDNLSVKMKDLNVLNEDNKIPSEVLDDINREYQQFITQKEAIIAAVKESQKKILGHVDDIKFTSLEKFLSTKYASVQKHGFNCDLCKNYSAPSLKAMAAHKRGCSKKVAVHAQMPVNQFVVACK